MIRRIVCAVSCLLLIGSVCGAGRAQSAGMPDFTQTATSSPPLDSLAEQIAQQIERRHLKIVAVIGAFGPKTTELTQDGQELGDKLSAALAKQNQTFQVVDRVTLRNSLKSAGVSEAMLDSDTLANWIARKIAVAGYVLVQITAVTNGRASIVAGLYKKGQDEGDLQTTLKTEIELSAEQKRDGFRPLDSDWNKVTYSIEELSHLPTDRKAACGYCPFPQFTGAAHQQGPGINETVVVNLTVLVDGHVGDVAVVRPARFGLSASAVEQILAKWHFKPALDAGGKATAMRLQVEVNFYDK